MTSTTSLMISEAIRREEAPRGGCRLDESTGPLAPRNIYGVTKLAAEGTMPPLCSGPRAIACVALRTVPVLPGGRRHAQAAQRREPQGDRVPPPPSDGGRRSRWRMLPRSTRPRQIGFGLYLVSAPPPFARSDAEALKHGCCCRDPRTRFPMRQSSLPGAAGRCPPACGRVYDPLPG